MHNISTKLTVFLRDSGVYASFLHHGNNMPLGLVGRGQTYPRRNIGKTQSHKSLRQPLDIGSGLHKKT